MSTTEQLRSQSQQAQQHQPQQKLQPQIQTQAEVGQVPIDEDLVDLQPDQQSMVKRMIAPKIIILTFLSLMFISKNIYNIYFLEQPVSPASNSTATPKPTPEPEPESESLIGRMYGYCIITAVLFVVYMLLVRANDRAIMKKIEEQKKAKEPKENKDQNNSKEKQQEEAIDQNQDKQIIKKEDQDGFRQAQKSGSRNESNDENQGKVKNN